MVKPTDKDLVYVPETPENTDDLQECITPQVFDLPSHWGPTKRSVVALTCYGLRQKDIAKQLGIAVSAVKTVLKDSGVKEITAKGSVIRKLLTSSMFEVIGMRCLSGISVSEIDDLPVERRVKLAETCVKAQQALGAKPYKEDKDDSALLDELRGEDVGKEAEKGD